MRLHCASLEERGHYSIEIAIVFPLIPLSRSHRAASIDPLQEPDGDAYIWRKR